MSKNKPAEGEMFSVRLRKRVGSLIDSPLVGRFMNFPPVAWVARTATRILVRRRISKVPVRELPIERGAKVGLQATLQQIAYDIVQALGYVGAMVAPYEQGDSLPVRAFYVDPALATEEQIHRWEEEASKIVGRPISITDPDIARVFLYEEEYKDNLSVKAFEAGGPVVTDELYDLCTPIASPAAKPFINGIQQGLGIEQLVAVPFFLETSVDGQLTREIVGNLFAAKRGKVSERDRSVLAAFGRQAAAAIESERRHIQIQVAQRMIFEMQFSMQDERHILQRIAEWMVSAMGYVGAMVAPYEQGDSLPVRAFYVDPALATEEQIHKWEEEASKIVGRPISITDPDIARVFLYEEEYKDNLSVKAFKARGPVVTDELYDLCTPIASPAAKPFINGIQQGLGIKQLIAVPFFLETSVDGQLTREIVGSLFAATRSRKFSSGEIELLRAFGQQAAIAIRNARLYRKSEGRRKAVQIFQKMAFGAAAYVHDMRGHIGLVRGHLGLLQSWDELTAEERRNILMTNTDVFARLSEVNDILDNLYDPWRPIPDEPTDVNVCLRWAIGKTWDKEGIKLKGELAAGLPSIIACPVLLREAFKVLLNNAVEAIQEKEADLESKGQSGELRVESHLAKDNHSVIEVLICDNGIGIKPENLSKIFEMGYSTKGEEGMGLGLFWTEDYIESMGGTIEVESVWQEGTTFRMRIPVSADQSDVS